MASAPRQASHTSSSSAPERSPVPIAGEAATVEESVGDFDLLSTLRKMVSTGSHPLEAVYTTVADASRVMSGADGTALALETKGIIVCRARSGDIAPGLGAPISTESGISGECLRTASMLVCHDTLSDPRVDAEVCQALGIRSLAAVPLLQGARGIGILEAFSARPNVFDGDALGYLRALAEIAQIAHLRELPVSAKASVTVPANLPVPAPQPAKYVPRSFTTAELSLPSVEPGRNRVRKVVALAVVGVLLTAGVAWWAWHTPDETTGSTQTAHAAVTVEATTPRQLALQVVPKPAPGVGGKRSASHSDIALQNAADLQPVEEAAADTTLTVPPGKSTRPTTVTDSESAVVDAPAVNVSTSTDPAQLARLASVEARLPAGGPVVSQGVVQPVLVHKVDAAYPSQARSQRLSGKVTLLATIAADGSVRNLTVMNGSPILAGAAKSAVQQWRYRPATLNGTPIDVQKEITFIFEQP